MFKFVVVLSLVAVIASAAPYPESTDGSSSSADGTTGSPMKSQSTSSHDHKGNHDGGVHVESPKIQVQPSSSGGAANGGEKSAGSGSAGEKANEKPSGNANSEKSHSAAGSANEKPAGSGSAGSSHGEKPQSESGSTKAMTTPSSSGSTTKSDN